MLFRHSPTLALRWWDSIRKSRSRYPGSSLRWAVWPVRSILRRHRYASELDTYSAVLLNLSQRPGSSWLSEQELMSLKAPLLAVGTSEELTPLQAIHAHGGELLSRPVTSDELLVRIRRFVARKAPPRKQRIVIADDDSSILALTAGILRGRGFECHEATDGRQALELARTLLPDLLILDLNMPFVSGFEILAALRNEPGTAAMTILLFTAAGGQEEVTRGTELGASSYLCKPFRPFDFLQRIKLLLPPASQVIETEVIETENSPLRFCFFPARPGCGGHRIDCPRLPGE